MIVANFTIPARKVLENRLRWRRQDVAWIDSAVTRPPIAHKGLVGAVPMATGLTHQEAA